MIFCFSDFQMKWLQLVLFCQFLALTTSLIKDQNDLENVLNEQLKIIDDQLVHLDWFFKVGYHHQGDDMIMKDTDEFISNPINTFTMIKRLAVYWPKLKAHLFNQTLIDNWDQVIEDLKNYNDSQ